MLLWREVPVRLREIETGDIATSPVKLLEGTLLQDGTFLIERDYVIAIREALGYLRYAPLASRACETRTVRNDLPDDEAIRTVDLHRLRRPSRPKRLCQIRFSVWPSSPLRQSSRITRSFCA